MTSGIYGIFQGNRVYIGQSVNIGQRWIQHKKHLKLNQHHCQFLQRVYSKHGLSSLQFSILEVCSVSGLDDLETKVWEGYEAKGFSMMNSKPEGGVLRGENSPHYGKKHTEETRAKMREAQLGKILTDEHRARMSKSRLGNNNWLGKKHTDSTRAKLSKSSEKFSYTILEVSTGTRYETTNITQWCKDRKVYRGHLCQTFDGPRKTSQGYKIVSKVEL